MPFNTANNTRDLINARAVTEGRLPPSLLEPALASFAEISMEAGFRAMVTYTPAAYTAYEGLVTFRADGVADLMRRFSRTQREWLRDATHRYGLGYLDLTPFLQRAAAASTEPLYFPHNQHFTAAGHRVVAAAIAEALRRLAPSRALPAGTPSATAPITVRGKEVATDSDPMPRPRPGDEVGTGPERPLGDVAAGDAIDPHPPRAATP